MVFLNCIRCIAYLCA